MSGRRRCLRTIRVFEQESVNTYAQAAEIRGLSRQRVYQLTSLVIKLTGEVKDLLVANDDPAILRYFTERRLRPLTKLADEETQRAESANMLDRARGQAAFAVKG